MEAPLKMVVIVVKRYSVREAKTHRYTVRNAKIGRYAVRKGGGGITLIKPFLYSSVFIDFLNCVRHTFTSLLTCVPRNIKICQPILVKFPIQEKTGRADAQTRNKRKVTAMLSPPQAGSIIEFRVYYLYTLGTKYQLVHIST